MPNILDLSQNNNNTMDNIDNSENNDNSENVKTLTSSQRAKQKYMRKYIRDPVKKIQINENNAKYYNKNRDLINEKRRKKLENDPEYLEKERARIRECSRKYREKKKLEKEQNNV